MKNRSKKILSLLLALVMVFSLLPMQAFAVGESRNTGVARKDLKPLPLPDCPAQTLVSDEIDGLTVTVEAPKGALPWGVEMNVTKLENLDAVQAAVDAMEDVSGTALVAADITFVSDGKEIQPQKDVTVTMTSAALPVGSELTVVHLDAAADELNEDVEAEAVENVVSEADVKAVTFDAAKFSVYAIIDPEDDGPVRATYYFQNADGTPYYFKDSAGRDMDNQIIKDGEYLEDVGAPAIGDSQTFLGWYVYNTETAQFGDKIEFGPEHPIAVTAEEDYDVIVRAKYDNVVYVTFYTDAAGAIVLERLQVALDADGKGQVDLSKYKTDAPLSTQAFVGWTKTPGGTEPIDNTDPDANPPVTANILEVTGNTSLYPVFKDAHWISFWACERGAGATYTAPAFVLGGQPASTAKPEKNPTWTGYVFKYWSETKPEYDDAGHVTNNAVEFDWSTVLEHDITLYAVWEYAVAKYTVMFYQQLATDEAGLADSAKHYEYSHSETRETTKGDDVGPSAADKNAPEGFVFNEAKSTTSVVAQADGTTVVEVYYDRIAYTLVFVVEGNSYQDYVLSTDDSGTQYAYVNGEYVQLTRVENTEPRDILTQNEGGTTEYTGQVYDASHNPVAAPYDRNQTYYRRTGSWWSGYTYYQLYWNTITVTTGYTWELNGETYTGARYKLQNTTTHIVKRIEALYGHTISDQFPIIGDDGTSYEGWVWEDESKDVYEYILQTIEVMPSANVTMKGAERVPVKTIYYYVEVIKGEDLTGVETRTFGEKTYKLYKTVTHNFNFLTYNEEYHDIPGFSKDRANADPAFGGATYSPSSFASGHNGDYRYLVGWSLNSDSADSNIARIPNYANYQVQNNNGTYTNYVYHHNNGTNFTYVSPDHYADYADEWVNYLYYDRNSYKLEFKDSLTNENLSVFETGSPDFNPVRTVQYEESLADYEPAAAVRPLSTIPGKEFAGWFEDPECQVPFDFENGTMPNHDHVVYAGWQDVYYLVKVDPNGGQLASTESTFFWLTYGKTVSEYGNIKREYVEVDDGSGTHTYVHHSYDSLLAAKVAEGMTEAEAAEWIWDHYREVPRDAYYTDDLTAEGGTGRYVAEANAYDLIGWYNVNEDGSLGEPYTFSAEVSAPVHIRAMWRRLGDFGVVYDTAVVDRSGNPLYVKDADGNPTDVQVTGIVDFGDPNRYADQSDSSVLGVCGVPSSNYVFVGWMYEGKIYNKGDVYVINSALADENKNVHLTPVFDEVENVPVRVTHINWYANTVDVDGQPLLESLLTKPDTALNNDEDNLGWYELDDNLQINAATPIRPSDTFAYRGYVFLGWAKKSDATADELFLKWVQASGEGDDAVAAHFEAETEEGNNEWVPVTEVAADEHLPYDDLYAVWKPLYFYLFHSATGKLEAIQMADADADGTYGIVANDKVTENYLYGGVYNAMVGVDADAVAALKGTNNALSGYNAYTGEQTSYWKRSNAWKTTFAPEADTVYYVKEVPNEFLKVYGRYTFNISDGQIQKIYLLTTIDQSAYSSVYFTISSLEGEYRAMISRKFTLSFGENSNQEPVEITAQTLNSNLYEASLLGIYQATNDLQSGQTYTITPTWRTLDGETVTGPERSLKVTDTSITEP